MIAEYALRNIEKRIKDKSASDDEAGDNVE
jgi:hypothetical protein